MTTLIQRLRQMADHTGLDAVAELLREAAEQLERLHAESESRAERIAALYEQIEREEELNSKLMAERTATMQRIVDKQTGYVRSKTQGGAQMTPTQADKIMALADAYADAYGSWMETRTERREALRAALAEQPAAQEPVATKTDGGITLHVGWDDVPVGAKLYAALQPVTAGEPVYWEYKHVDDDPDDWQRVVPRTMQTLEVALAEIQGYRMGKKKLYEVRALYTAPQPRKRLSNQEIYEMYNDPRSDAEMLEFARAIEAAHGIGETK